MKNRAIVFDMLGTLYLKSQELVDLEERYKTDKSIDLSKHFVLLSNDIIKAFNNLNGEKFIATGGNKDWAEKVLENLGVSHFFKPNNIFAPFDKEVNDNWKILSASTNANNREVFFIGDTINYDMKPANLSGMKTVWINHFNELVTDDVVSYTCNSLLDALIFLDSIK